MLCAIFSPISHTLIPAAALGFHPVVCFQGCNSVLLFSNKYLVFEKSPSVKLPVLPLLLLLLQVLSLLRFILLLLPFHYQFGEARKSSSRKDRNFTWNLQTELSGRAWR